MKFTEWLALPQLSNDSLTAAKYYPAHPVIAGSRSARDFIYGCQLCDALVGHLNGHEDWHRGLGR